MARPKGTGGKPLTAEHRKHIAEAMHKSVRHQDAHEQRGNTQRGRMRPYWLLSPKHLVPDEMRMGAVAAQADLRLTECPECAAYAIEVTLLNEGGKSGVARCLACLKRFRWRIWRKRTELMDGRASATTVR